jgi:uncharacterized protein YjbJ (UPF0337 family)
MNKDQSRGVAENIKGRVKEAAGILTGNKTQEAEGGAERVKGAIKKAAGDLKHKLAERVEKDPADENDDAE